MAEFIGDEGFLETIVDDTRRPANHKAQWTEAALRELEMLVMRKETCPLMWNEIIKLLEVEPRQSAPQEYINLQKDRFSPEVHLRAAGRMRTSRSGARVTTRERFDKGYQRLLGFRTSLLHFNVHRIYLFKRSDFDPKSCFLIYSMEQMEQ